MTFDTLRTWAEVDLDAIAHNFRAARNHLPKDMKLLVTVKANAYGHGALRVAQLLQNRVDYFAHHGRGGAAPAGWDSHTLADSGTGAAGRL